MNPWTFPPDEVYRHGLCTKMPAQLWWEPADTRDRRDKPASKKTLIHVANAKALCQQCDAFAACNAWVIGTITSNSDPLIGVVCGGLDSGDRNRIAKELMVTVEHGTARGYRQHAHRGEDPCAACRHAYNAPRRKHERKAS